jgi:rhomboid protease GluP
MLNEPPESKRKQHPLERPQPPAPSPEESSSPKRQQVTLHIPIVKPWITFGLIAVNLAIFILTYVSPDMNYALLNDGANNQRLVLVDGEYMRLLTSMFLHGGIAHIIMNMYALYIIGGNVEGLFGHARFAWIYFLGGLSGSLASVIFGGPFVYSVGASGAVFAIFGAEMIYLYQHRKLLGANAQRQLQSLVLVAVLNLAVGFLGATSRETGAQIDNWGHIGGFIGGLVLTWYIGPFFLPRKHPEREDALVVEDINPLSKRYQTLSLYAAALLTILIAASLIARQ